MSRVFAWSDLHVDYPQNLQRIAELSDADFKHDTIMVAGDVSSDLRKVTTCLEHLRNKFRRVAFVPGNHDLWVSRSDGMDSLGKLQQLHEICDQLGVHVRPFEAPLNGGTVRIFPLLSWYIKPEDGNGSLYVPKPGEDPTLRMWADNQRIKWPSLPEFETPAELMLQLNILNPPRDSEHW